MRIDSRRYIDLHKYVLIAAASYYLLSLFVLRSLQLGVVFIITVALFDLFFMKYYSSRLKIAALNWLVPILVALLSSGKLLENGQFAQQIANLIFVGVVSLVPMGLLATGKSDARPSLRKTLRMVKVRIFIQLTVFTTYLVFSGFTWIKGSTLELVFWAMLNLLTVSFLPFLVGRALCGWICPNATLQDALYKNLNFRRPLAGIFPPAIDAQSRSISLNIAGPVDKNAPYLPFTLLAAWFPMFFLENMFNLTEAFWYPTAFMYGLFIFSLLMPWRKMCTNFCWLSSYRCLAGQNSLWRLKFNPDQCRNCKVCLAEKECPFGIDIRNQTCEMPATCCVCFSCMNACPFDNVITYKLPKDKSTGLHSRPIEKS